MGSLYYVDPSEVIKLTEVFGGEDATQVVKLLLEAPGLSDEELAERLGVDVKQVRKTLHKLLELSLVTYTVTYEKENGKRTFRWRLQLEQLVSTVRGQAIKIIERLKMLRDFYGSSVVYWCGKSSCRKLEFSAAVDHFFKCPSCGDPLQPFDPSEMLKSIDEKISELSKLLR
ncbi:MAG: hypothetical protein NZ957_02370 [Thaumarchaeota archaeon]|nr:hypothetical protein [Candidatus Calditenuaceae archaeon]MDW8041727.1 hypothetical protein [Nitrososphaerota archaeon]